MPACKHCHRRKACRPRGLCTPCYDAPGVRESYPARGHAKYSRRGVLDRLGDEGPPPFTTAAGPGTPAKEALLTWRAANGFNLWHKGDADWEANSRKEKS